jgi:hypothetical protein
MKDAGRTILTLIAGIAIGAFMTWALIQKSSGTTDVKYVIGNNTDPSHLIQDKINNSETQGPEVVEGAIKKTSDPRFMKAYYVGDLPNGTLDSFLDNPDDIIIPITKTNMQLLYESVPVDGSLHFIYSTAKRFKNLESRLSSLRASKPSDGVPNGPKSAAQQGNAADASGAADF